MSAEQIHEGHLRIAVCAQTLFEGVEANAPHAELGQAIAALEGCAARVERLIGGVDPFPYAILRRQIEHLAAQWAEGEDITGATHSLVRWLTHLIRLEKRGREGKAPASAAT